MLVMGVGPLSYQQTLDAMQQAHRDTAMNSINDLIDGDELINRLVYELQSRSPYTEIHKAPQREENSSV